MRDLQDERREPKISVVIPTYNEEKYIRNCIESLLNQTLMPYEIIVVDDGSTDNTYSICSSYGGIVKVFAKEHSGAGPSRNFGVSKASGDIIVFFDADMVAPPDYIEKLVRPIIKGEAIGTDHGDEFVVNSDNVWARCWCIEWRVPIGKRTPHPRKGLSNVFRAIRKDVFLKAGGFDEKKGYCDDNLGDKNMRSIFVEEAFCYHYNPSSLKEVFQSAVWIGRGIVPTFPSELPSLMKAKKVVSRLMKHSIFSPLNGVRFTIKHREPLFWLFKLVYDFGIAFGIITYVLYKRTAK